MSDTISVVSGTLNFQPEPAPAIKFPSIPDTGTTTDELRASVDALKEAVELLSGVNANGVAQAITPIQMASLMGTSTASVRDAVGNWGVFDTLQGQVGTVRKALIATKVELTASVDNLIASYLAGDKRLAGSITTLSHSVSGNAAAITHEQLVRSDADISLASDITSVTAIASRQRTFTSPTTPTFTAPDAAIVGDIWIDTAHANLLKVWDGHAWTAYDDGRIAVNAANITTEATARATADTAMATNITNLTTRVGTAEGAITTEATARATADSAISGTLATVSTKTDTNTANITAESTARSNADGALATRVTSVETLSGNATAGGYYRLLAGAGPGGANSSFQVQVSATNDGTGWGTAGLTLEALGSGSARCVVTAGQFVVDNGVAPFSIIGGELRFGGRIYGSDIVAGSITAAQIAAGAITADRIQAGSISATELAVGGVDIYSIAAGAATNMASANLSNQTPTLTYNSQYSLGSMSFTTITGNVLVLGIVECTCSSTVSPPVLRVAITIDGLDRGSAVAIGGLVAINLTAGTGTWLMQQSITIPIQTTLGAGTHTIEMKVTSTASTTRAYTLSSPTLIAFEARR